MQKQYLYHLAKNVDIISPESNQDKKKKKMRNRDEKGQNLTILYRDFNLAIKPR